MGKVNIKVIDIYCKCGQFIAKYEKRKRWQLVRIYIDQIKKDWISLLMWKIYKTWKAIYCPNCKKRLWNINMDKWKLALKINRWAIQKIIT